MINEEIDPSHAPIERRLSAVFSADVQAYNRLMGDDEEATVRCLTQYRDAITTQIQKYNGRVVDAPGDNLLAEFASAVDAVKCAVRVQKELAERNSAMPDRRRMLFRIGINVGDVLVEGSRIYGDGVKIAVRVESLANGGGICISGTAFDQVESKLDYSYEDLGEQALKNIAKPTRIYRVHSIDESTTDEPAFISPSPPTNFAAPEQVKPAIAVLPFQNLSGDAEQEYFSDGMTEDLITDLSKISGLLVISRNSVFSYKGSAVSPEQLSMDLGVSYLVEGSVRKIGNRVRISAQLVDVKTKFHLWAERYDRQLDDIFAVQDEVIQQIVTALTVKLTAGERKRVGGIPTENLEAYDAFVRGREQYVRREREANMKARELFQQAIRLDGNYAQAHAFLGRTYLMEMVNQWSNSPDLLEQLFEHGRKALALDDTQPTAYETLAFGHVARREHDQAIEAAQKAVQFDPNFADGYISLGEVLSFSGQPSDAIPVIEHAMRLNPRYTPNYLWALGQAHRLLKNYDDAITIFRRVITRNPDHLIAHVMLTSCYVETEQLDEAKLEAQEVLRINPSYSVEVSNRRSPYKDTDQTRRQTDSLRRAGLS